MTESADKTGPKPNEKVPKTIHKIRHVFKLKDILIVIDFPNSTYMYWQKHFDREDADSEIKADMLEIREKIKIMAIGS